MISIEEVSKQLQENVSIEFTSDRTATYFLHMTEDGQLDPFGPVSFHADRDISEFSEDSDASRIYETETLDNPDFRKVCENLVSQANNWVNDNR